LSFPCLRLDYVRSSLDNAHLVIAPGGPFRAVHVVPTAASRFRSTPISDISFFLAPHEAIDLGAADRLAQDRRVGDPADGVGMIEQLPARLGRNDFPG
jgi:hypothetical protein